MDPGEILGKFINLYWIVLLLRVLFTWLPSIDFSTQPFRTLADVSDPYLNLFRGLIPPMGGFDISTMIAILLLQIGGPILAQSVSRAFASYAIFMVG